ncbi:MAG: hypothetical protein MUF58_07560 [Arcicella sp.]|jgi:hypothetical protein|nr:hypothetical protein [Arcicella sp.]
MNVTTDTLNGFDMIAAISQKAINSQFEDLFWADTFPKSWTLGDDSSACMMTANLAPPTVTLATAGKPNTVILFINMPSGTFTYWVGHGPSSTQSQVDFQNWVYAFDVNVDFLQIEQTAIANAKGIPDVVKDTLYSFDSSMFSIQSLFMDFENSNIASYDPELSHLPLPDGSSLSNDPELMAEFQMMLQDYFISLEGTDNPYILGYSVNAKNPSQDTANFPIPTFVPTGATFSTLVDNSQPNGALNALNFLVMTDNHPMPQDVNAVNFKSNWIKNTNCDGTFVIAEKIFWNQWLLPMIEAALTPVTPTDYNCLQAATTPTSSGWQLNREYTKAWIDKDAMMHFDLHNSLDLKFDATVVPTNQIDTTTQNNQVLITINGNCVAQYNSYYEAVGIKTEMDVTSSVTDWTVTITLTTGNNGIIDMKVAEDIPTADVETGGNLLGGIGEWLSQDAQDRLNNYGQELADQFDANIKDISDLLSNVNNQFVSPAGDVFFFSDISVDDNANLLSSIRYKEEN